MLRVVQFEFSRRYGLQNTWTGTILSHKGGSPLIFRTRRKARKLTQSLESTLASLNGTKL